MKKQFLLFCLTFCLLLCGCQKGGNEDFTQRILPAPEKIEIRSANSTVEYLPESSDYQKIYNAILPNWWKTTGDNKAETASNDALFSAEAPGQLKTTTNRTYRESGDTLLCFLYETQPLSWVNPTGPATEIQMIAFLLPTPSAAEENVKGVFTISKTTDIGTNEGLFAYYYPPEIASGFWDFLLHE